MFPNPDKFKIGDRVRSTAGWLGTIIKKNKQRSSPWKVRWDKNELESNENAMSINLVEEEEDIERREVARTRRYR